MVRGDTYKLETYNIDIVVAGRLLFDLYATTKEAKYLTALQTLRKQIEEQQNSQWRFGTRKSIKPDVAG
jgi:unsaturated rhamnogalacturonyl hydrolase